MSRRSKSPRASKKADEAVVPSSPVSPAASPSASSANPEARLQKLLLRMGVGLVMIAVFIAILLSHHWVVVAFCILLQIMSFRELISVRFKEVKEQQLPWFRTLSWLAFWICEVFFFFFFFFFFCSFSVFTLVVQFAAYGTHVLEALELDSVVPYHGAIAFTAFVAYFTLFVLSLKKKKLYKYQMTQVPKFFSFFFFFFFSCFDMVCFLSLLGLGSSCCLLLDKHMVHGSTFSVEASFGFCSLRP